MYRTKLFILQSIGKILQKLNRGSSLVGYLDNKLNFNILKAIDLTNKKVIFVVGTNGKTTITNLVNEIYKLNDKTVLSNLSGANMLSGIKNTLIMSLNNKQIKEDVLLLEVDERSVKHVAKLIKPNEIILTNFFRDQLDRYFEISIIIEEIIQTITTYQPIVYYSGQDPLIYKYLKEIKAKQIKYMLSKTETSTIEQTGIVEIKYCPNCTAQLDYEYYHYAHIGQFACPNCDFQVENIDYEFTLQNNIISSNNKELITIPAHTPQYLTINYCLILNYALNNDLDVTKMQKIVEQQNQIQGRNNQISYEQQEIYLNLAKNVAGMEQSIAKLNKEEQKIDLLIAFNDNYADGKDVSWIWDVEFAKIISNLNSLHIVGSRKYDMQLRFLYENYDRIKVYQTINEGLREIVQFNNPKIISNYTPLQEIVDFFNSGVHHEQ